MLEYREDAKGDLVEIVVGGRVSKAEFDEIATRLEAAIARHGKLRVLEVVKSFGGIEPSAFWADLKFGLRHLNDFSRCAVVSDKRWIETFARGVDKVIPCEIRHFRPTRSPPPERGCASPRRRPDRHGQGLVELRDQGRRHRPRGRLLRRDPRRRGADRERGPGLPLHLAPARRDPADPVARRPPTRTCSPRRCRWASSTTSTR